MKKPIKAREYNLPTKIKSDKLFVKSLKLIKEYLPLIILLPAILGGLWQIIELSSMSIPFIRFFSVTQLIADGFLVILVILPLVFVGYLYYIDSGSLDHNVDTKIKEKRDWRNIKNIVVKILIFLCIISIVFLLVYILKNDIFSTSNGLINYLVHITLLYSIFLLLDLAFLNSGFIKFVDKLNKNKIFKKPFRTFLLIIFVVIIPMIFHSAFYVPRNLENIENLEKYNQNKNATLRYFNDKYIFLEHKKEDNSTTVQVVPFEELFDRK